MADKERTPAEMIREVVDRLTEQGRLTNEYAHALLACADAWDREQQRDSPWQPIETAPKDGTPVLIGWHDDAGAWQERRAWWDREFAIEGCDDDMNTLWKQAWTDYRVASFGYEEVWEYEPTHWMPLPAPPVEKP